MSIDPNKMYIESFTRKRKLENLEPRSINGVTIRLANETKYFLITQDEKIN